MRLFSKKGYEQTSIEELAREAGIGKGTIYSYFQTKRHIVRSFCEDQLEFVRQEITTKTNPDMPLREQFMAEFQHLKQNKEFGRLFLQEKVFPKDQYSPEDLEMQHKYFELLYPIYQQAKDRGEIKCDIELLHISGQFYAIYLLLMSCWFNGMVPSEEMPGAMETMITQAINGLKP